MLKIKDQDKDLGAVRLNTPKTFTVDLVNDSDSDLVITDVRPQCGACTVSRVSSAQVAAHATIQLISTFTPQSTGAAFKKVNLKYEQAGLTETIIFSFKAQVS